MMMPACIDYSLSTPAWEKAPKDLEMRRFLNVGSRTIYCMQCGMGIDRDPVGAIAYDVAYKSSVNLSAVSNASTPYLRWMR